MKKIIIAGIGGVGGYFGGKISKYAETQDDIEVHFFVRGDHAEAIRRNGLQVESPAGNFITHPASAGDNASKTGTADLILFCTKSYGLETCAEQLKSCIGPETVLLPLLNGVDSSGRLRNWFPANEVWEGCVYLVGRRTAPGIIRDSGNVRKLFFGSQGHSNEKLKRALAIFSGAGMEAVCPEKILEICWEKFVFISVLATLTSAYDKNVGDLRNDPAAMNDMPAMLREVLRVARTKSIDLGDEMVEMTLEKIRQILPETKTSMHSDFLAGGATELESLTGFVVREAHAGGIEVPLFEQYYQQLKKRG